MTDVATPPAAGDAPLGRAVGDAARYFMTMIDWTAVLVANPSIMAALHTDYEAVMAFLGAPLAATAMRNLPPPELAGAGFRCVHRNSPSGLGAGAAPAWPRSWIGWCCVSRPLS